MNKKLNDIFNYLILRVQRNNFDLRSPLSSGEGPGVRLIKLKKSLIFLPLYFLFHFNLIQPSTAQDIHFSQFYQSPFNLNPGLTGQFDGAYRFIANQRTQWRSVTTPYSTFGLSADARQPELPDGFLNSRDGKEWNLPLNTGLSFFNDKAGDSQLKTTAINLALSKEIPISKDGKERVVPGIMLGFTSMRIDYSALRYDNQWNGAYYDPGINPQEQFARSSRGYFNLNLGISYFKTLHKNEHIIAGISLFNLNNPRQSFFDDGYVKLDARLNVHGQYRFHINRQWMAEPMMIFMSQGTYREFNIGGLAHYILEDKAWTYRTLYAGIYGRVRDAGYLVAGMQYDAWNVGISYDINTSNLRPASNGRGGFEFSVIYIIPPRPKAFPMKVCPDYM